MHDRIFTENGREVLCCCLSMSILCTSGSKRDEDYDEGQRVQLGRGNSKFDLKFKLRWLAQSIGQSTS
jgi:hypothetical protein